MIRANIGRWRDDRRIQRGGASRSIGGNVRSGRNNGIELNASPGVFSGNVCRRGRDHVGRQSERAKRGTQAFGGRRSGIGLERQQVSDCGSGRGKFEIGRVDDLLRERTAAGDANGLRAMMRFLATGARVFSGLCSAQIFRARKLVPGIINDFIGPDFGCGVGAQAVNLPR